MVILGGWVFLMSEVPLFRGSTFWGSEVPLYRVHDGSETYDAWSISFSQPPRITIGS